MKFEVDAGDFKVPLLPVWRIYTSVHPTHATTLHPNPCPLTTNPVVAPHAASGCISAEVVILHGSSTPNLAAIVGEMPPIQEFAPSSTQFIDLNTDQASCLAAQRNAPASIVVYDDGSLPGLQALAEMRNIQGSLLLYGVGGSSGIASLLALKNLEVGRGWVLCSWGGRQGEGDLAGSVGRGVSVVLITPGIDKQPGLEGHMRVQR